MALRNARRKEDVSQACSLACRAAGGSAGGGDMLEGLRPACCPQPGLRLALWSAEEKLEVRPLCRYPILTVPEAQGQVAAFLGGRAGRGPGRGRTGFEIPATLQHGLRGAHSQSACCYFAQPESLSGTRPQRTLNALVP